jgi:hypothetical protein
MNQNDTLTIAEIATLREMIQVHDLRKEEVELENYIFGVAPAKCKHGINYSQTCIDCCNESMYANTSKG